LPGVERVIEIGLDQRLAQIVERAMLGEHALEPRGPARGVAPGLEALGPRAHLARQRRRVRGGGGQVQRHGLGGEAIELAIEPPQIEAVIAPRGQRERARPRLELTANVELDAKRHLIVLPDPGGKAREEAVMRIVIFGLSVSSAWGNGHATLWRSLISALDAAGNQVVFFERDAPYYREHRDLEQLGGRAQLRMYASWDDIRDEASRAIASCDAAIVTSYCPDARPAAELVLGSRAIRVFYDLDTPVTLSQLDAGNDVPYVPHGGLGDFDLVLSYTGGQALALLRERLGARRVAALYGSVEPLHHYPVAPAAHWRAACSYLGTWSEDRDRVLDMLFLEPARRHEDRFLIGGPQYPAETAWPPNVTRIDHVAPPDHAAFYCSSPLTLSVTRAPMAALGFCPSGRLFEAAACGVPVLSDGWDGLDAFFTPGDEILVASSTEAAIEAIALPRETLARIGRRARARAVEDHSSTRRAAEMIALLEATGSNAHGAWT
jgi:spore maturation protein CgeB